MILNYIKDKYRLSDERMAICNECEHLEPKRKLCNLCGCFMEFKTMIPGSSCPAGKWTEQKD